MKYNDTIAWILVGLILLGITIFICIKLIKRYKRDVRYIRL